MSESGLGRRVYVGLSVLAIGGAVAILIAGESALPSTIRAPLQLVSPTVVITLVSWFGAMLWLNRARRRTKNDVRPLEADWPESPTDATHGQAPAIGATWASMLETATSASAPRDARLTARDQLESELRVSVTELYAMVHNVEEEEARTAIDVGAWSDDRRATALLGGVDAPSPSLFVRLLDLLRPGSTYTRQIEHAVAAARDLAGTTAGGQR